MSASPTSGINDATVRSLRQLMQEVRRLDRAAEAAAGLSGAALCVLEELAEAPADSLNDVATRLSIAHSSASVLVTRLEGEGLLATHPHPDDARLIRLRITAAGRRLLDQGPWSARRYLRVALEQLPPRDVRALTRLLTAWSTALSGAAERE